MDPVDDALVNVEDLFNTAASELWPLGSIFIKSLLDNAASIILIFSIEISAEIDTLLQLLALSILVISVCWRRISDAPPAMKVGFFRHASFPFSSWLGTW